MDVGKIIGKFLGNKADRDMREVMPYVDKIKETFYELARDMIFDPIEITLSDIIGDAGVIGAAALSLE